ncbi:pirin family protein [Sulfidibacter corallicola]|nr:hypothetical protein [Sulfidibacter corallicola]
MASRTGPEGSISLNQDADLYATLLDDVTELSFSPSPKRAQWLHVAKGRVTLDGQHALKEGDGVAIRDEPVIALSQGNQAEVLLFDLATSG